VAGRGQDQFDDAVDLERLDAALLRLRRLWTAPRAFGGLRMDVGSGVELSTVLVVDALIGQEQPHSAGVDVRGVAMHLDVAPSTASRLVERAVSAGMVERRPASADARRVVLRPTRAGRRLHKAAVRFRTDYLGAVLRTWPRSERRHFIDLLDRFADAVAAAPTRPTR